LPLGVVGVDHGPGEANVDRHAVVGVAALEASDGAVEATDDGWVEAANGAVCPVDRPLTCREIEHANGHADEAAVGALELVDVGHTPEPRFTGHGGGEQVPVVARREPSCQSTVGNSPGAGEEVEVGDLARGWGLRRCVHAVNVCDFADRFCPWNLEGLTGGGYAVEAFAGHGGGYRLGRGGALPPLLLDDDESLAVALGLRLTGFAALPDIDEAAMSALAKIEQLLPLRLRERLDHLDAITIIDPHRPGAVDVLDARRTFTTLARASACGLTATFDYIDQHSPFSRRRVEPSRLVHTRARWYLVAYDLDRNDWRTFRLDRITRPDVTSHRSAHRDGPDPIELVESAAPPEAFTMQATVRLNCTTAEAATRIPPSIAVIAAVADNVCTLTIGTDDETWLIGYLMSLLWEFEVVNPRYLRARVAACARTIAARHDAP
jgi:predicted DNA-binding transcriptional regulator YafY